VGGGQARQAEERRPADGVVGQRRGEADPRRLRLPQLQERLAGLGLQDGPLVKRRERRQPVQRRGQAVGAAQR
jgi:hypothetical protein